MNLDKFIETNFNKAAFKNVSFSEFKKTYTGSMRGFDIKEVAEKLGINTTEKKVFKPKSVGKKKK
jgi:hypothetical protein